MIIPFLSGKWQKLTDEQLAFLTPRADIRFRQGACMGWGRRFSILIIGNDYYAINSAYGYHHLENLMGWLARQDMQVEDYTNYLNRGMLELGL